MLSQFRWPDILTNEHNSLAVWSAQHGVTGAWYLIHSGCVFFLLPFFDVFISFSSFIFILFFSFLPFFRDL